MTNGERYKTADEREQAYTRYMHDWANTPGMKHLKCFEWLEAECRNIRPYSAKELDGMMGMVARWYPESGCPRVYVLNGYAAERAGDYPVVSLGSSMFDQNDLMRWGVTIDGKPWGVEV